MLKFAMQHTYGGKLTCRKFFVLNAIGLHVTTTICNNLCNCLLAKTVMATIWKQKSSVRVVIVLAAHEGKNTIYHLCLGGTLAGIA